MQPLIRAQMIRVCSLLATWSVDGLTAPPVAEVRVIESTPTDYYNCR